MAKLQNKDTGIARNLQRNIFPKKKKSGRSMHPLSNLFNFNKNFLVRLGLVCCYVSDALQKYNAYSERYRCVCC